MSYNIVKPLNVQSLSTETFAPCQLHQKSSTYVEDAIIKRGKLLPNLLGSSTVGMPFSPISTLQDTKYLKKDRLELLPSVRIYTAYTLDNSNNYLVLSSFQAIQDAQIVPFSFKCTLYSRQPNGLSRFNLIAIPPTTIQVPHRGRFSCVSQLSIEDSSSTFSSRIHRYHRRSPILPKFEIFLTLTFHIFENHSSMLLWWNTHKVSSSTI